MSVSGRKREALSQGLRAWLTENGQTQAQLAKKLGCDPTLVSRYVTGSNYPSKAYLDKILVLLGHETEEELQRRYSGANSPISRDDRIADLKKFYQFSRIDGIARVNIVTSSSDLISVYKDYSARNYIALDNHADRDAVLQVSIDIARCYPDMEVKLWKAEEFTDQVFSENTILVGGPSFSEYTNNTAADRFIQERSLPILFDDESLNVGNAKFEIKMNADGSVNTDYGVIVRIRNMFRPDRRTIFLMGHFSWGVTAAASALSVFAPPGTFVAQQLLGDDDQIMVFPIRRVFGRGVPDLSQVRIFNV